MVSHANQHGTSVLVKIIKSETHTSRSTVRYGTVPVLYGTVLHYTLYRTVPYRTFKAHFISANRIKVLIRIELQG